MIKFAYKYYLKFPPFARTAISVSLGGIMGGIGIDYFQPNPENILIGCDDMINKKIFK